MTSQRTGREAFFEVARSEGVRYLFANPGSTELPIFDELVGERSIELVLALHEAVAVAAADGYAQASGRPALVNLHIAPGLANGLANILNASWARSPVVVTAGNQDTRHVFQEPMLAADLVRMVDQFCKWACEVRRPQDIGPALRRAFKVAASPPAGPVFLSIPWNYLSESHEVEIPPPSRIEHDALVSPQGIHDAASMLLAAERPRILAGDEVARAGAVGDLVELADLLGAPVVGEPLHSRLVFPMDHPHWMGAMMASHASIRERLEGADVVLALGASIFSPFFYSPVAPIPSGVALIQIDPDPYELGKTYAVSLGLRGDVGGAIRALVSEIGRRANPEERAKMSARVARLSEEHRASLASLDSSVASRKQRVPLPPIAACSAVVEAFDGAVSVVDESVSATASLRAVLRERDPGSYFFFRGGALGWGISAAAGVKLAQPDRQVVAVVGDGATLYVPQALWTLAHHDIPVVVVILNNAGYYILKAQLLGMEGKAAATQTYPGMDIVGPAVDFPSLAHAFGVPAERVETSGEVTSAVRKALSSGGPFLVEVAVDSTVRPLR